MTYFWMTLTQSRFQQVRTALPAVVTRLLSASTYIKLSQDASGLFIPYLNKYSCNEEFILVYDLASFISFDTHTISTGSQCRYPLILFGCHQRIFTKLTGKYNSSLLPLYC